MPALRRAMFSVRRYYEGEFDALVDDVLRENRNRTAHFLARFEDPLMSIAQNAFVRPMVYRQLCTSWPQPTASSRLTATF
jgi:hypothetical protein